MAHPLREKAAISGVGDTAYTRGTPKSALALQLEASLAAIADAGLSPRDIDGVVPYFPGGGIAEDLIANLDLPDLKLSVFVPMGGATVVAAIQTAAMAVATRIADCSQCLSQAACAASTPLTAARSAGSSDSISRRMRRPVMAMSIASPPETSAIRRSRSAALKPI